MCESLRSDARAIFEYAISEALPDRAVRQSLSALTFAPGRIIVVAVGKAAWTMAYAASQVLGEKIASGVVITKYQHSQGPISRFEIIEAAHPIPDQNAFLGARMAVSAVSGLKEEDTVLFLLSGGGSTLFELSELSLDELQEINRQLLACGASIQEINTIRKRLSLVKGGRFARLCAPARVVSLLLSDIIDSQIDMIASGPTCPDLSTSDQAIAIAKKYALTLSEKAWGLLSCETPKELNNTDCYVCGSVSQLCQAAAEKCRALDYETHLFPEPLSCYARDAGIRFANLARAHAGDGRKQAFIAGGETVVYLTGSGLGGRNQELALAAAEGISGLSNVAVFSIGSDGTDGPTDAAGGFVDGNTKARLAAQGICIENVLKNNDSYHALERCSGLIKTGATGTNVNDLTVLLILPEAVSNGQESISDLVPGMGPCI